MAKVSLLERINASLPENWEAQLTADQGRIYYLDHGNQISSWIPPSDNWDAGSMGLPYGWESAVDKKTNKQYFINHVDKYTTPDDPRDDPDYVEPPKPREVDLVRDSQKGFGFVAGSEKPVVVRFVTEGGPSVDKLLPGDQIIKINGEDVKKAPRQYVIDLVRSCQQNMTLTVCQPYTDNSSRKSALLTAAKKAKLKNNPSRVRFAENVTVTMVNGISSPSTHESYVPFMPNVLKVFLENGQTKSFKYDNKTTVKDVTISLQEKLGIKSTKYFNLVLQNMKSHMPNRLVILQEHETLSDIAAIPGARHFRCLFRVMFVPKDAFDLLNEDSVAFEYFYMQCCNDVVNERFSDLKPETVLKLSALQMQQHAMANNNNMAAKVNIKAIEKDCGLDKFVPASQRESMKLKDLRKLLTQQMKMNQNLTPPGQKHLSALQAKLHYVKIVSELKTFGSRVFMVTLLDQKMEAMVLVGPKAGISLITNIKHYTLSTLADYRTIETIKISKEKETDMRKVEITVKGKEAGTLNLGLMKDDVQNFVAMVEGYYKIFVDPNGTLVEKPASKQSVDPEVPPYLSKHHVLTMPWSYPEDIVSQIISSSPGTEQLLENERVIDLRQGPPMYEANTEYIARIKQDLGIQSEENVSISVNGVGLDNGISVNNRVTPPGTNKSVIVIEKHADSLSNYTQSRLRPAEKGDTSPTDAKKPKTSSQKQHSADLSHSPEGQKFDELSDTDSGVESEKKLPVGEHGVGREAESDSDSFDTPSNSPGKDAGESFGLHSPDVLPRSESDFEAIASSFGLLSPDQIPPGIDEGILDPRMFSQRQLYIDPDIIDLTLLPPLSSPEDAEMSLNSSATHFGTWSPEMLQSHIANSSQNNDVGRSPTFHRSVSDSDNPDFFDSDIDDFIAKMTVQPPPNPDEADGHLTHDAGTNILTDNGVTDEFSALVIPPPPGDASEAIADISIVPPVSQSDGKDRLASNSVHRRSSSLDTNYVLSSDISSVGQHSQSDLPYENSSGQKVKSSSEARKKEEDFDSPAYVSERLSSLLQSMPMYGSVRENRRLRRNVRRTSSLKLTRSSSADIPKITCDQDVQKMFVPPSVQRSNSFQSQKHSPNVVKVTSSQDKGHDPSQTSNVEAKVGSYSRHLQRSGSFTHNHTSEKENKENIWMDSSSSSTSGSNETLSSLKATLKSYRDFLLSKSHSTKKERRPSISSDEESGGDTSSLKRSNSFTTGWLQRKSSQEGDPQRPGSDLAPGKTKDSNSYLDKKGPHLLSQLTPRSKLCTNSPFSAQEPEIIVDSIDEQKNVRKYGPIKAMNAVTSSLIEIPVTHETSSTQVNGSHKNSSLATQDDLDLSHGDKQKFKDSDKLISPFGTVGSMWRPMSMSKHSSIKDHDSEPETRTYNNFDLLRDMSSGKVPVSTGDNLVQGKPPTSPTSATPPIKSRAPKAPVTPMTPLTPASPPREVNSQSQCNGDSLQEQFFTLLKEEVHENHSDMVREILKKVYGVNSFGTASSDTDCLLAELKQTMESLKNSRLDRPNSQFDMCKDELILQVKSFVQDAKLLVSNATQTKEKLAINLNQSMHTLAKVFLHCQATMIMMEATHQAQHLGFEVIKVTNAYKSTVNAAQAAVGKPLVDPHMKYLMRQARNLASLLSSLLKTLKSLEQK